MEGAYVDEARMEPLQLGVLAALTPKDIEVVMYDDRMEDVPFDEKTDLVAITVETYTAKRSYEISKEYQKRGVAVVLGGMHPTLIPQEASQYADSIVIGDAETVWKDIIFDMKEGKLKKVYKGEFGEPQPGVFTDRDIFKGKGYLPLSLIQFTRGCKYNCQFCASSVYFKQKQYCRKIADVVAEIKAHKLKLVFFVDDNIVANKERAKRLFKALIPLKIKWVSQASIDMTEDLELMELMKQSGCLGNVIGFESINIDNLRSVSKVPNIRGFNIYQEQIEILRKYNQQTWAAFTLGHEYDTVDTVKRVSEFAIKNKFAFAAFNILMPYPNTPLYDKLKSEGRLLYNGKWWLDDSYRFNYTPFKPKSMTAKQLTEAAYQARKKFNSPISIIKRSFDLKTHMSSLLRYIVYFQYNPLIRKEIYKKQGMLFGKKTKK